MSITQNPIIGRAKGQAGGMVFTTLNGKNIMKAKTHEYRDANTAVQSANRLFHKSIVRMAASLKTVARSLFLTQPTDMPAFSKLVQQLHAMRSGSSGAYTFDPTNKQIGSGTVLLPFTTKQYSSVSGELNAVIDVGAAEDAGFVSEPIGVIVIDKSTKTVISANADEMTVDNPTSKLDLPSGLVAGNLYVCAFATKGAGADLIKSIKVFSQVTAG